MPHFFATNRDMHHLGRALPPNQRSVRHKLSRGGYYFVNMQEYTRFYLATTNPKEMPAEAIVADSDKEVFGNFLSDERIRRVVVCVHGFNVELFEAFTWFRVLTDTMKNLPKSGNRIVTSPEDLRKAPAKANLTAFLGFSWPSNGNVVSYVSDQRDAIGAAAPFASFLARLKVAKKSLNLICHSMGNFLACHTFAAILGEHFVPLRGDKIRRLLQRKPDDSQNGTGNGADWLVDNYVMLAPDVERRHVTKCAGGNVETDYVGQFYSGLEHLVHNIVNVYSRHDTVLTLSNYEKIPREVGLAIGDAASKLTFGLLDFLERNPDQRWEKRLGSSPAPLNAAPGFTSVNATELADRKVGHGDHIDARAVMERIAAELRI